MDILTVVARSQALNRGNVHMRLVICQLGRQGDKVKLEAHHCRRMQRTEKSLSSVVVAAAAGVGADHHGTC